MATNQLVEIGSLSLSLCDDLPQKRRARSTKLDAARLILLYSMRVISSERGIQLQPPVYEGRLNAESFRFAIVASKWNEFITGRLVEGALNGLERLGAGEKQIAIYRVPGAFEIPLMAQRLAQSRQFDAVICLGTIIRGQTPHFDYIANEVARGISNAALETGVPVVFGVVTADTVDQAIDRAGVKLGNKGFEAAMTAVELVNLYKEAFKE